MTSEDEHECDAAAVSRWLHELGDEQTLEPRDDLADRIIAAAGTDRRPIARLIGLVRRSR